MSLVISNGVGLGFRSFTILIIAVLGTGQLFADSFQYSSANFHIHLEVSQQAKASLVGKEDGIQWSRDFIQQISDGAEQYRNQFLEEWFGEKPQDWEEVLPVFASLENSASGFTVFDFIDGRIHRRVEMQLKGDAHSILKDVLPHEINHTVFVSHFKAPIPRWADEGAATLMETEDVQTILMSRYGKFFIQQLQMELESPVSALFPLSSSQPGAYSLDQVFNMLEYPENGAQMRIWYAQSTALVRFLVEQKGKRGFGQFLSLLFSSTDTQKTLCQFYEFKNDKEFKSALLDWLLAHL